MIARPLGKGFDRVELFLSEYLRPDRDESNSTPDLGLSLGHFQEIENIEQILSTIRQNPLCLIEGCTSPTNGKALKEFLEKHSIESPTVHAIDLIDVGRFFRERGIEMSHTQFFVADATDLRQQYADSSVDVVAQDFLLNCAPYVTHLPILQEVHRVLRQEGIGLICFTDHGGVASAERITYLQAQKELGIVPNEDAFCIRDLLPDGRKDDAVMYASVLNALTGKIMVNGSADKYTLVTSDGGNFEFFRSFESTQQTFHDAGLKIVGLEQSCGGTDRNGIAQMRYRAILRRM